MQTANPSAIIAVILAAGGVAKATGGMVLPSHDFTGAMIVFGASMLFMLAGWFLRGWGAVTSPEVTLMMHNEFKELRKELSEWKDEQRQINEDVRLALDHKQDRQWSVHDERNTKR